ncbi:MAG: LuxR C-terminal-related transcriptional regulator [Chloroflexota bacterium]
MSASILATKLYMPPPRPKIVVRPRLIQQLNQALHSKLILISAPAGFGKTTLTTAWINSTLQNAQTDMQVAWLSLDEGNSDLTRFLIYMVAALQTIDTSIGTTILGTLQAPQPFSTDAVLTTLINELAAVSSPLLLVLDDYHLVDAPEVDQALAFLVERLPPQIHLLIATREDPNLPLPRLRARSQLAELRAADLRFTADETAVFLNQVIGLTLSAADIATLETRTEGWIAGLQLAALSMQGEINIDHFIQSFTGSHHFILDSLLAEVLQQQPEPIQHYLQQTAVLDRFCGSLCDAVLEAPAGSSQETLATIEQANLFVIPLDQERRWYRYHHLFADLLRQRLQQTAVSHHSSFNINTLHRRASIWFEANHLDLEAFHHAAAANDIDRAHRLLEGKTTPLYFQGIIQPTVNWLKSLPPATLDANPALWVIYASALTVSGQPIDSVKQIIQRAETALANNQIVSDDLVGRLATLRAMLAIPDNELDIMLQQAQQALAHLAVDNLTFRAAVNMTLSYAYLLQGDLGAAKEANQATIAYGQASDNITFTMAGFIGLGNIQEAENRLHEAHESYLHVLELGGKSPLPYVSAAYLGLVQISYEWGDWDALFHYGELGIKFGRQMPSVDVPAACKTFFSRAKLAQNDLAAAAAHAASAQQAMQQKAGSELRDLTAVRIQLLLQRGDLNSAASLAKEHNLPLSLARVHLAQGDTKAALALLANEADRVGKRPFEQLKIAVLQAVAYWLDGQKAQAIDSLHELLLLAAAGGFVRTFVDVGEVMREMLQETAVRQIMPSYTAKLLAAFGPQTAVAPKSVTAHPQDALSQRELEVLQLIAQGHSNREISQKLFVALDTVKGHNRKIFGKLQVQRRTEAVARARELGLL